MVLALALLALVASWKFLDRPCADCRALTQLAIGESTIYIDVADTVEERAQGLSGKESLAEDMGLLFVFESPDRPGFWMKDMRFPIDIIWINSRKVVTGVEKDISPETYPNVFRPNEAIKYVLEVQAGFAQRHGIDIGDEVYFEL